MRILKEDGAQNVDEQAKWLSGDRRISGAGSEAQIKQTRPSEAGKTWGNVERDRQKVWALADGIYPPSLLRLP
mgnify:CR=1 FL=1